MLRQMDLSYLFLSSFCFVIANGNTIATTQCKPGSSFEAQCQHCSCSDEGIFVCKRIKCDPDKTVSSVTLKNEQLDAEILNHRVCKPNEIKIQGCDECKCASNGDGWTCTSDACLNSVSSRIITLSLSCIPNELFNDGCNICTCDSSGTAARCKETECDLKARQKRSESNAQPGEVSSSNWWKNQKIWCPYIKILFLARPTESLRQYIKTLCQPTNATTTKTAASEDQNSTMRIITEDEVNSPTFACVPGESLKLDCNTCWCSKKGNELKTCTRIACSPRIYSPLDDTPNS